MRLLHIADLHIGKRVNGMSMLEDQRYILAQIVSIAKEQRVDAVLVAGDIYDKASPSAEAVTVLDAFVEALADEGIRVVATPGNHDSAERIAFAQGLLSRQGVYFPPVYEGEIERVDLQDEHGPVAVWLIPFLKPGDVRRFFPDKDIGDDYAAALSAVIGACDIDRNARNIAVSHQLVTWKGEGPDRADDEIRLGGIDNVDASVYDAFDYVALGHVHRPQRIGRDTVRYAGSPLKYSFSEARYEKSVVVVEVGPKPAGDKVGVCVSFELVPLVPLRDMREIRTTLAELLAQANGGAREQAVKEEGATEVDGTASPDAAASEPDAAWQEGALDYVHITLTDEHPQMDAMARVREVYPNTMLLDYDNATLVAARDHVRAAVDPSSVDMADLFARFYEEQVGKPLDDIQHSILAKAVADVEEASARGDHALSGTMQPAGSPSDKKRTKAKGGRA